jgi:putative restriction endonuclease
MATAGQREKWLKKIAKLRIDRARGTPAPHKPLLLLVIFDLAEAGQIRVRDLALTGELTFRFLTYWSAVDPKRSARPDIRLPFFYLKGDGVWRPLDQTGAPATHYRLATSVRIDTDFLDCLGDEDFLRQARILLATRYFPPSGQIALESALGISLPAPTAINEVLPDLGNEDAAGSGREARFRLEVVPAYDFTCALTGYRLVTVDAGSIVEAAHIHQFAESRNNDPTNGIALSKNAHWLFDQGLWSVTDDFRVLIAKHRFHESGPAELQLTRYEGRRLNLPASPHMHPASEHLRWHRLHHGFSDS